jgi:hypothetical protein
MKGKFNLIITGLPTLSAKTAPTRKPTTQKRRAKV